MVTDIKQQLEREYTNHAEMIDLLCTYINNIPDAPMERKAEQISKAQNVLNGLYSIKSCDAIIEAQVILNQYRNKFDVHDPLEVSSDVAGDFVQ